MRWVEEEFIEGDENIFSTLKEQIVLPDRTRKYFKENEMLINMTLFS